MTLSASESYTPDRLLAGDCCLITDQGTLFSGQNLKRGAALGKITATGKLVLLNTANADDGSRSFHSILAADCDASTADKTCQLYLAGEFNSNAVTFGGADTAATHKTAARALHTYLKDPVKA